MICSIDSTVSGSRYTASATSGSVMIVAGFELTRTIAMAFLAQRAARLNAGVVEFGSLTDDDRSGADDHDIRGACWSHFIGLPTLAVLESLGMARLF